jgi:predicted MPP superfamily phosphohydrolase
MPSAEGPSLAEEIGGGMKRRLLARLLGQNWARLSYARMVEPFWLETNHIDIRLPDLDPRLDGLTIGQLSDLHLCRAVPASHVRQAVDRLERLSPDVIALTGDFVHAGFHYVEAIAQLVGRLRAPLGVYAVLGNHDYSIRVYGGKPRFPRLAETVEEALVRQGIVVLKNEHRLLQHQGAPLAVAGVCDLWSGEADLPLAIRGIQPDVPRIVLAHHPGTVTQAEGRRCDLILSGHTHGGQVEWGTGPLARFKHRLGAGLYFHDSGYLYVHKGIGYTVRFRFRVRPEVALFRLRRWDKSDKLQAL